LQPGTIKAAVFLYPAAKVYSPAVASHSSALYFTLSNLMLSSKNNFSFLPALLFIFPSFCLLPFSTENLD